MNPKDLLDITKMTEHNKSVKAMKKIQTKEGIKKFNKNRDNFAELNSMNQEGSLSEWGKEEKYERK